VAAFAALNESQRHPEGILIMAGVHIVAGKIERAITMLDDLLEMWTPGPAGWIIPIDPMLAAIGDHSGKQALFAKLAARAA
jgi:hypothetical protein